MSYWGNHVFHLDVNKRSVYHYCSLMTTPSKCSWTSYVLFKSHVWTCFAQTMCQSPNIGNSEQQIAITRFQTCVNVTQSEHQAARLLLPHLLCSALNKYITLYICIHVFIWLNVFKVKWWHFVCSYSKSSYVCGTMLKFAFRMQNLFH